MKLNTINGYNYKAIIGIAILNIFTLFNYYKCDGVEYRYGHNYHSPCYHPTNQYPYYGRTYYGYCVSEAHCCSIDRDRLKNANCTGDWFCCIERITCQACQYGTRSVNGTCVDINECAETYGLCSGHGCINTNGSYTCECYDSFHMIGKTKTCRPINHTISADLLFSATRSLNLFPLSIKNNSNQKETIYNKFSDVFFPVEQNFNIPKITERNQIQMIYSGMHSPKSIDYSFDGNYIVWTDAVLHQINIAPLNNKNPSLVPDRIILRHLKTPICTTIDWIHNLIYWIDIELLTINVISIIRPDDYYILVNITNQEPKDIVINVFDSFLYWNHIGVKPKIMRSSQDGSNQTVLYSTFKQAFCLTIDNYLKRIYFIDIETSTLYSINFDGKDERSLFSSKSTLHSINSMSIYYDDIYLSSYDLIFSINKFGHNQNVKLTSNQNDGKAIVKTVNNGQIRRHLNYTNIIVSERKEILSLKVIDPSLQPLIVNKCQFSDCSHLCLPVNNNNTLFRCICPENYILVGLKICTKNKFETMVIDSQSWENDLQKLIDHSIKKTSDIKRLLNQSFTEQISLRNMFDNALKESNDMKKLIDIGFNQSLEIKKSYIQSVNDSFYLKKVLNTTLDLEKLFNQTKLVNETNEFVRLLQSFSQLNISPEMSVQSETGDKSGIIITLLTFIVIGMFVIILIALLLIGVRYDFISVKRRNSQQIHLNPVYGCNRDSSCVEDSKI